MTTITRYCPVCKRTTKHNTDGATYACVPCSKRKAPLASRIPRGTAGVSTEKLAYLQQRLDAQWMKSPELCEQEGLPRKVPLNNAWQLLCLASALGVE